MLIKLAYRFSQIYWFLARPVTLGTRVMLVKDDKIVLVKHSYQDAWYLPGGGVKRGETLEQSIRREAAEECGASLNQIQFLGIYTNFIEYKSDHIALFLSQDFILSNRHDREIERVATFSLHQLPRKLSPGSRQKIRAFINENLHNTGMW